MIMTRNPKWTDAENDAVIALWFKMADHAAAGEKYVKKAMINAAIAGQAYGRNIADMRGPLAARTRQSVEFKLMNVSACVRDIDADYFNMADHGYKAYDNYQATLKTAVQAEIERRAGLALLPDSHPAQVQRA